MRQSQNSFWSHLILLGLHVGEGERESREEEEKEEEGRGEEDQGMESLFLGF